ncbi:hypothetical protein P168DRAFT_302257 [Aspergillus campestris IBT 28561]|uniref:PCI domain-containing protein n=1 Tax=Aspergillus campestris (strain IBT 28561) TaxID=1392248 RepID=A0A2I1DBQ5_ASPC2|nr:uncharacterized protein P168DRAFT_302257 [Aspergillus campestris IBT 28561]PKY07300.1 hypothetical protein P168DRAFT_302257 [Aspergillus campestris IBT 28561]
MDQSHARAIEALQPFIHLATSSTAASPRFVANLITNAIDNPNTYVFAELLDTPAVQSLSNPDTPAEFQPYRTLLEIFAWGTWDDYQSTSLLSLYIIEDKNLTDKPKRNTQPPPPNPPQTLKLRLLTLLTLSATTTPPLTYPNLMTALSITAPSDLESLITTAIYANLITARLAPASNPPAVHITAVAPLRDVNPALALPAMIARLSSWESRCGHVIADLEAEIARIRSDAVASRARHAAHNDLFQRTMAGFTADLPTASTVPTGATVEGVPAKGSRLPWSKGGGGSGGSGGWFGAGGNKREFSADDLDIDDGYGEAGGEGEGSAPSSQMDVDEGAGSSRLSAGARHAKRILGRKT